jgi:hypothetical protein
MRDLLPVGTYVAVQPPPIEIKSGSIPYTGRVVGYDMHRSKYEVGYEYLPGQFGAGGWWAFPGQVRQLQEA